MIEPFKGELFIHPAALEFSGNTCSNACAYCFASLRCENRRVQLRKLSNLCLGKTAGLSHTDWLFNQGHAVCFSNRSDPFCTSNIDNTGVALQLLDLVPNGVLFQTKGLSKGVDFSLLDGFKKRNVVVYITIDTLRDDIERRIEPGAPLPRARIDLARYAKQRGWEVIVGLNPYVPQWMPDADLVSLEDELASFGVTSYLCAPLSLSEAAVRGMPQARRERMEPEVVADALNCSGGWREFMDQYWRMNHKPDLHVYSMGGWLPCHMDDRACACLGKHMNSVQHFVDFAWDEFARSGRTVFSFADFARVMTDGNPEMFSYESGEMYKYILACNRGLWKQGGPAKKARSFIDVYRVCWNEPRMIHSPQNVRVFTRIADSAHRPVRDRNGDVLLAFLGGGGVRPSDRVPDMSADDLEGKGVKVHDYLDV